MSLEKKIEERKKNREKIINMLLRETEREEYQYKQTLEGFFRGILDYFDIKSQLLEKYDIDYIDEKDPYELRHTKLNDVEQLLFNLEPVLELAYKLSESYDITEALEKGELKSDSVVKMVENFIHLHRTGRKKKFYDDDVKRFKKFKMKNKEIFTFLREYQYNIKIIEKYNITKDDLESFLRKYNLRFKEEIEDSSRSTLYRYDKDMYFLKEHIYELRHAIRELERKDKREYALEFVKKEFA